MLSFDELVAFDPVAVPESIITKDMRNRNVGGKAMIQYNTLIYEGLRDIGDTYHSCPFFDTVNILADLGFAMVSERVYFSTHIVGEIQRIYWHEDGILAVVTTARGRTNTAAVYYNWVPNTSAELDFTDFTSSGSLYEDPTDGFVWVGSHYLDKGLRHVMAKLRAHGRFVPTWLRSPYIGFLAGDEYDRNKNFQQEVFKHINHTLPPHILRNIEAKEW